MTMPVDIDLAKQQLGVDGSEFDDLITAYIQAAVDYVEGQYGLVLSAAADPITKSFDRLGRQLVLNSWPVGDDIQIAYLDRSGAVHQLDASSFRRLPGRPVRLVPTIAARWPIAACAAGAVTVTYSAGFAQGMLPASIQTAILMLVANWFRNREAAAAVTGSMVEVPLGVTDLLRRWRLERV